jgi:hypothetical protein
LDLSLCTLGSYPQGAEEEGSNEKEDLLWVGELLIDQFVMWNRWWRDTRQQKEPSTIENRRTNQSDNDTKGSRGSKGSRGRVNSTGE